MEWMSKRCVAMILVGCVGLIWDLRASAQAPVAIWATATSNEPARSVSPREPLSIHAATPNVAGRCELESELRPLLYRNPGLKVDLGVGLWAWPIPTDADGDGDFDLLVACPDQPSNGVWFFENISGDTQVQSQAIFRPGVKLSPAVHYLTPSYTEEGLRVLSPGREYPAFERTGIEAKVDLPVDGNFHQLVGTATKGPRIRHRQWSYSDYDGDGLLDLVIAIEDWSDYGWDDAYDPQGRWTAGPLHGFVYWLKNVGSNRDQQYEPPRPVCTADGNPVDVFGCASPQFKDFDSDGDLDLLCGEFLDGFRYFQNIGTREQPQYQAGVPVTAQDGSTLRMDLQMIVPVAYDWDQDGRPDLVVGDEDGRVAWCRHRGEFDAAGTPVFDAPQYFQQEADALKCGALSTPVGVDWDGDGDWDLVSGNTAGYLEFFENLSGAGVESPRWAAPRRLQVEGQAFRVMAGPNGSIQGPAEAKWGYTTLSAADWDDDGRPDLIVNSIWGKVFWLKNLGPQAGEPRAVQVASPQPIEVQWTTAAVPKPEWLWWTPGPRELVTQWRTTPVAVDWNRDGLTDLVMLDHEGYLAWYPRAQQGNAAVLLPPKRIFVGADYQATDARHRVTKSGRGLLRLNQGRAGSSGRRKLCVTDWDGDGQWDVLVNSTSAHRLVAEPIEDGRVLLHDLGPLTERNVQGHSTSPGVVDFNQDGLPELIVGAEDGRIYYLSR